MKLSDFNIRTPVRKKSSLVFNLNNEQQEKLAETKIKSLEDEVVLLKNELLQLRPLPDKIDILEKRLLEKEQRIHNFKKTREQDKILLQRAEEKVSRFSKQEEEIKQFRIVAPIKPVKLNQY